MKILSDLDIQLKQQEQILQYMDLLNCIMMLNMKLFLENKKLKDRIIELSK